MKKKWILYLTSILLLTLSQTSFAEEVAARPRPPHPTPNPTPKPTPTGQWFKPRTLVCDDANLRFELKLESAKPNGLIDEGQPHFDQHATWSVTAKSAAEKTELGKLSVLGTQPTATANAFNFDGNQTGWYSPSLKTLVGTWVWVPNATDVFKNMGIVQPKSGNLKVTLEDGTVHDHLYSTVVRMDHVASNVTLRIDTGAEGGSAVTTYSFPESQCHGEDGP